jgi:hypothetical protein
LWSAYMTRSWGVSWRVAAIDASLGKGFRYGNGAEVSVLRAHFLRQQNSIPTFVLLQAGAQSGVSC